MSTFKELCHDERIMRALQDMQFSTPTEIQEKAIPLIRQGIDLIGKSHTGTGKTLAFGIPAAECVKGNGTQVLIISPTRELAMQTADEMHKVVKYTENIRAVAVYGGQPIQNQIPYLRHGAEIVIGTPGRLMDHLKRKTLLIDHIKMVVLDEADEMLDMGFREDIESILKQLPTVHQTLLFSATMPPEIQDLAKQYQKNPQIIEAGNQQEKTIDTIEQYFYYVPRGHKPEALSLLLCAHAPKACIVFCNTKKKADELCRYLNEHQFNASALHGDMKQEARTAVMQSFKSGHTPILIATDVAARGIDVSNVNAVYNFDLPQDFEYYIHRIGRTGRAGKKGVSYTLVCGRRELEDIHALQKFIGAEINQKNLPASDEIIQQRQDTLIHHIVTKLETETDLKENAMVEKILDQNQDCKKLACVLMQLLMEREMKHIPDIPTNEKKNILSRVPEGYVRLRFSLGRAQRVAPNNIVAAIAEITRIPGSKIQKIHCFKDYSLVEVPIKYRNLIISKVNGMKINGQRVNIGLYDDKNKRSDIQVSANKKTGINHSNHLKRSFKGKTFNKQK